MNKNMDANYQKFSDTNLKRVRVFTIRMPKGFDWEPRRATVFMKHLLSQFGQLAFCITAQHQQINWQVFDLSHRVPDHSLVRAVQSIYPQAQLDAGPYMPNHFHRPFYRSLIHYRQANDFIAPMRYAEDIKELDPLATLVQGMRNLHPSERVSHFLFVLGSITDSLLQIAQKRITVARIHPLQFLSAEGIGQAFGVMLSGNTRAPKYQERDQRLLEERLRQGVLYNAFMMTQVDGPDGHTFARIPNLMSAVLQFASQYNALVPTSSVGRMMVHVDHPEMDLSSSALGQLSTWFDGVDPSFSQVWSVLSVQELAALWHLPHSEFTAPEIGYTTTGQVSLPFALIQNNGGVCLGFNPVGNQPNLVRMQDEDRATHINVLGKTGVGKSTLIHAMIHQDIQAGKGVGLIDPHGQLVSDILRYSIPDQRMTDVVLLDIANETHPPPINPMLIGQQNQLFAAGQVIAILDKIYDLKAQRVEDSLTAALVSLMQEPTPTFRDVVKLFTDIAYRHQLLTRVDDAVTHEFWLEFERQSPSVQRELSYPILHRMRHFYRNPVLAPILCHPDALDLGQLIAQKKIILLSLGIDERKVPTPERQLLGAVLVSQLQMAVMHARESVEPFFLYIDEAQNFITSSLEQVLAEARKFGLHLTLANQYLSQLKGSLLESILGTVGATVLFQCGLHDARTLAPFFQPQFTAEDLMNLPLYYAAVKMRHAGQTLPAFSLQTLPPPKTIPLEQANARERTIRQLSVSRYTPKTRDQVTAWLDERFPRSIEGTFSPEEDQESAHEMDWTVPER